MSKLEEVYVCGRNLVRIDIYANRCGLKLKTIESMISRNQLVEVGYMGNKYIDTNASGSAAQTFKEVKHEPISKVTTWSLHG
jgi:hypothetical protein